MKTLGIILLFVIFITGFWLLSSLYLMVGVGIVHLDWWSAVPLMSYKAALLVDAFIGGWIGMQVAMQVAVAVSSASSRRSKR